MLIVTTPTKYIKADDGARIMLGRNKNIIVLDNGEKISPEVIENALDNIPLINQIMK